jgi:hypothetical protein
VLTALWRAAQLGARLTLWVKPTGGGPCKLKSVDPDRDAYDVAELWANQDGRGVRPAQVALRWPKCPPGALNASKVAEADRIQPWQTMREVGVEDGHVLLADVDLSQGGRTPGAAWLRVPHSCRLAAGALVPAQHACARPAATNVTDCVHYLPHR